MNGHSSLEESLEKAVNDPSPLFSPRELALLDPGNPLKHAAIIMDGNRRWAKQRGLAPMMGHWEGAEVLTDVMRAASELGIKTVTVYSFSTENWNRPTEEIDALMRIFEIYLTQKKESMIRDGIRLDMIGDLARLPDPVQNAFLAAKKATQRCAKIDLVLALNYGARDEIRRAMVKILNQNISSEELTEDLIARHLDTYRWGDPELVIRTSGELRVSNFLLWQISYAEIYVTEKLWPDFSPKELFEAVLSYQRRRRRRGGV